MSILTMASATEERQYAPCFVALGGAENCDQYGRKRKKAMRTASLTIRDIPRPVLDQLKRRAERHRRSIQGEILAILESAAAEAEPRRTVAETLAHVRALGLRTPAEAMAMVREDRDGR